MLTEIRSQTLIATLIIGGCFSLLLVYAIRGVVVPDSIMTLIASLSTGVVGWYFGARGTASGQAAAHDTITSTAQGITQVVDATMTPPAGPGAAGPTPQR